MQIVAKGLTYVYNPKSPFAGKALSGVDLTIDEGEFFGIIGHTGSGKSTFVQHLNALLRLTGGSLKVGEYDLADKKCNFLELRSKVGMVFQYPEYQLFAETVEQDVAFGLKNFRKDLDKDGVQAAVKEALETVGLDWQQVKDSSPFELSGGQKRRVAIAGVIVTKPEILILDEPAAGLDPLGKQELMQLLHSIHGGWCKTIVIVSHDMDEIAENCTRAAVFFGRESGHVRHARRDLFPQRRTHFARIGHPRHRKMRKYPQTARLCRGHRFYLRRLREKGARPPRKGGCPC